MSHARQFALPFPQPAFYTEAGFLAGPGQEEALAWLRDPESWPGRRLIIYGEAGTGKTHLVHVFARSLPAAILPACAVRGLPPLPDTPALAVDDADEVTDETALLHLLNAAGEADIAVLLTGRAAPAAWAFALPDLQSRLRAMTAVKLPPLTDEVLRALLARLLAERQLAVPEGIQDFLLVRLPRTGTALREAAARLDRLSLAEGRQVTRDIAAEVIQSFELE